jgi:hypothetical protein
MVRVDIASPAAAKIILICIECSSARDADSDGQLAASMIGGNRVRLSIADILRASQRPRVSGKPPLRSVKLCQTRSNIMPAAAFRSGHELLTQLARRPMIFTAI